MVKDVLNKLGVKMKSATGLLLLFLI